MTVRIAYDANRYAKTVEVSMAESASLKVVLRCRVYEHREDVFRTTTRAISLVRNRDVFGGPESEIPVGRTVGHPIKIAIVSQEWQERDLYTSLFAQTPAFQTELDVSRRIPSGS